ncbi:MAG: DUF3592 domain-containing protein [bacterium]|nr:DUF3592 domain-containing protein [bacterium]
MSLAIRIGFAAAMVAIGVASYFGGVHFGRIARESKSWPTVTARITRSEMEESEKARKRNNRTVYDRYYKAKIGYEYTVDGQTYTSDRIAVIGAGASKVRRSAETKIQRYPVGKEVNAYYNPEKPSYAILEPGEAGLRSGWFLKALGVLLGCVGIFLGFFANRFTFRHGRMSITPGNI